MNDCIEWKGPNGIKKGRIEGQLSDVTFDVIEHGTGIRWIVHKNDILKGRSPENLDSAYDRAMKGI